MKAYPHNSVHADPIAISPLIDYTKARHCRKGGFCFYRLEEPNGSDTYYAISILTMLGIVFNDGKTFRYLTNQQKGDGSYESIFSAYYSIRSLSLMGARPLRDSRDYLLSQLDYYRFDAERLPAEVTSLFKRLLFLIDLSVFLDIDIVHEKQEIIDFVLSFRRVDCGFGNSVSSLPDTVHAATILQLLGYLLETLNIKEFIQACETPVCGFTGVPGTSLSYIEHIHGGVTASCLVGYKPRYIEECLRFIKYCQTKNGGFSRGSDIGIATLEYSFYALDSLSQLTTRIQWWPFIGASRRFTSCPPLFSSILLYAAGYRNNPSMVPLSTKRAFPEGSRW